MTDDYSLYLMSRQHIADLHADASNQRLARLAPRTSERRWGHAVRAWTMRAGERLAAPASAHQMMKGAQQ